MPETVEIGLGRSARRAFRLSDIALVPTRRTRGTEVVSMAWQIDAHAFDLPFVAAPSDAVVSPASAVEIERLKPCAAGMRRDVPFAKGAETAIAVAKALGMVA